MDIKPTAHDRAEGAVNPLVVAELHRMHANGQYRVYANTVCRGCDSSYAIDEFSLRTAAQLGNFRWARDGRIMLGAVTLMELSSLLHPTLLCQRVMIRAGTVELAGFIADVNLR